MSGMSSCNYSKGTFCNGRPYGINKQEDDCRFCKLYPKNEISNKLDMRITIDETNKTITVESGTNLKELYDYFLDHKIDFANYTLIDNSANVMINNPYIPWTNPGIPIVPQYPYGPFWTNPVIY